MHRLRPGFGRSVRHGSGRRATTTSVTTAVTNYTSESGDKNVSAFLSGVTLASGYLLCSRA